MIRRALQFLLFSIAFSLSVLLGLPEAQAKVVPPEASCAKALSSQGSSDEVTRYISVTRDFTTPRGRRVKYGEYRLLISHDNVTDVDGLVEKGFSFDSFASMLRYMDPGYDGVDHYQFRNLKYRLAENSVRTNRIKSLLLNDHTRTHDWENLTFIPTDDSALYSQTNQTKRLFKRLKQLRHKYLLQTVPPAIQKATPQQVLEYYVSFYKEALLELDEMKIKNVENPAEEKANLLIDKLHASLVVILLRETEDFRKHFTHEKPIDLFALDNLDYKIINFLRSHLRAAITEIFVAFRVPQLQMLNATLREAQESGLYNLSEAAVKELIEARAYDREFDIITAGGIYEVKANATPDLYEFRPGGYGNGEPHISQSQYEREQKFLRQEAARKAAVDILKKYGQVSADFTAYKVFADGKIQEKADNPKVIFGLVDMPQFAL